MEELTARLPTPRGAIRPKLQAPSQKDKRPGYSIEAATAEISKVSLLSSAPIGSLRERSFPSLCPSWPLRHYSDQPFANHDEARFCAQLSPSTTKADILISGLHATSVSRAITKFKMPAMSPTMTEGGISSWKKREGDSFTAGDVLLEIVCHKQ